MIKEFEYHFDWFEQKKKFRADPDDFLILKGSSRINGSYEHRVIKNLEVLNEKGEWDPTYSIVTITSEEKFYTIMVESEEEDGKNLISILCSGNNPDWELHGNAERAGLLTAHYD